MGERMTGFVSTETFTQAEFAEWLEERDPADLHHYELLEGRIVMEPPAGWPHGESGAGFLATLHAFVRARGLGRVFDASQGFDLPSGDTVEPDVAFIGRERWQHGPPATRGRFLPMVPDLLVEVLSPSTGARDRSQKKRIYARNRVSEYWLVDPATRTATRFVLRGERYDRGVRFEDGDEAVSVVLPGFRFPVRELFPEP